MLTNVRLLVPRTRAWPSGWDVVCWTTLGHVDRRSRSSRRDHSSRRCSWSGGMEVSCLYFCLGKIFVLTPATRWMYIVCAIITIPVGIIGYFVVPGTIDQPNPYIFKEKDLVIARKRLDKAGHALQGKLRFRHIKEIMSSKHFWIVVLVDIFFWNAGANSGAFLLWLKSLKKYDSATVNEFGTIPSALGIFLVLFVNFSSDLLWGPVWGITFASGMNTLSNLILVSAPICRMILQKLMYESPAHLGCPRRREVVCVL